ncbi:MAG: sn stearoyl-lipid 9-desaturase [Blastocatellia bacterium]|jgi:stearoyl-CoA desaturase (delta-9 desaturase)|nr:sn stearoyl-lipid 9-desaturase [Blastocatellia bacterium]MDX6304261.1 sn stearoyl-lipid 9-desaturase [Blastocatellia bacterium]
MQNEVTTSKDNTRINWHTATFMALFHIGAVAALFMFSWQALVAALVLWWISASLGVGMGFHRLLTHRGYKTPKLVEYFITVCGLLALEGGAINWVVTHRIHHAHTDAPGDPHTPREGGWWAHIGWMLKGTAQSHDQQTLARYAPDMVKDRFHVLANNFYWIPIIFLAIGLLALGGWSFVLWAVFFRITFNFHATWLVNSATHMWGRRRFATRDDSTNNWWVALLTFGEGWHNNHHAYPTAARHGLAWYEIDLNWWGIRTMQFLRLAKNVKLVRLAEVSAT